MEKRAEALARFATGFSLELNQETESALDQYSPGDRDQTGIDEAEAVRVLLEKYEIVRAMFAWT